MALRMIVKKDWYTCGFMGCNKQLWGTGANYYCDEHRVEQPKGPFYVRDTRTSREERDELEIENQYLREQLAECQEQIVRIEKDKENLAEVNRTVLEAYGRVIKESYHLKQRAQVEQKSLFDPAGIRYSNASPTGRREDGTVWYTKDGHTYWSPGGVV